MISVSRIGQLLQKIEELAEGLPEILALANEAYVEVGRLGDERDNLLGDVDRLRGELDRCEQERDQLDSELTELVQKYDPDEILPSIEVAQWLKGLGVRPPGLTAADVREAMAEITWQLHKAEARRAAP